MISTFKNVGNGDSILLSWKNNDNPKVAIIDCKKYNSQNPILDEIKDKGYQEIEFIVLSHPHFDHYSGFVELFDYCIENNVSINIIFFTFKFTREYLKGLNQNVHHASILYEVGRKIRECENLGTKVGIPFPEVMSLPLSNKYTLIFLSPDNQTTDEFLKIELPRVENPGKPPYNNKGNLLSTVILIVDNKERIALFTSDVEIPVLRKLSNNVNFRKNTIILAQVPHHGSAYNHTERFWQLKRRKQNAPAVISSGRRLNQPDPKVVQDFKKLGFSIYFTSDEAKYQGEGLQISSMMDLISSRKTNTDGLSFNFGSNYPL